MWAYPEIRTLGDFPSYYARTDPQRIALKSGVRTVSFAAFENTCRQLAHFLTARETVPGSLIGFLGKNSFDFYFALFGCAKTRAALVVLSWRLTGIELAAQIEDSETRLVFVERELEPLWLEACQSIG